MGTNHCGGDLGHEIWGMRGNQGQRTQARDTKASPSAGYTWLIAVAGHGQQETRGRSGPITQDSLPVVRVDSTGREWETTGGVRAT